MNLPLMSEALFKPSVLKVLGHELRFTVFVRLTERPWTPREIAEDLDEDIKRIYEALEALMAEGLLEVVAKEDSPNGGPPTHRYRCVKQIFTAEDWAAIPLPDRESASFAISGELTKDVEAALAQGTFDSTPSRVLVRYPLWTNAEGVEKICDILVRAEEEVRQVEEEGLSQPTPVHLTVGLLSFESAQNRR